MRTISLFAACLAATALHASDDSIPTNRPESCMQGELAQFGRYIGNWDIADETLDPDGDSWIPGPGARWNFVCIGDGTAVQDFWLPNDGGVGTNLRTWNSATLSWDIAWAVNGLPGFAHIVAKQQDDGRIVMHWKTPNANPERMRRITFYPPDKTGWRWTQEWSQDGGESWFEVYRIRATPSD